MRRDEKIVLIILALVCAGIGAGIAFNSFMRSGVQPDMAAGYSVVIFLAILGAFGLIAVSVRL
jgi:hypothetical protein